MFHLFAEHSVFAIAGFIVATGLGAIVFYQSYVVLYCGPARHEPNTDRSHGWGQRILLAALLIVLSMGFAPQLWSGD